MKPGRFLSRARNAARRSPFRSTPRLLETLESRMLLTASVDPIAAQTASDTNPLYVPVTGSTDQAGLTYTVSSNNPSITATVVTTSSYLQLNVAGFGVMDIALFGGLSPLTVAHITSLVNSGFYTGLDIFRVYPNFMMQMGSPTNNGQGGSSLGTVADEFTNAFYSGDGQLAMANSGSANSGDSQFFITQGPQTFLNGKYTLFGQLVRGFDVRTAIMATPLGTGNESIDGSTHTRPVTPVVITSASIITDTTDAVIAITAGANQSGMITVTANDGHGNTSSQSFALNNAAPFINPIADQTIAHNTTLDVPLTVTNPNSATFTFLAATSPVESNSSLTNNNTNYHFVPDTGFTGDVTVSIGLIVSGTPHTTSFTVHVTDNAPTLTTISQIPGASQDTDFTLSYATLLAASDIADADAGDPLLFQIQAVTNGTLTKGGLAVTGGTTTLGPGESLVWHSNAGDAGNLSAFTVKAYDGMLTSATAIPVVIQTAQVNHIPTLTTISALAGGPKNQAVTITYAQLLAASDAHDIDNYDTVQFLIDTVDSGSLTKNGSAVVPGATLLGPTESLVWSPALDATGVLDAFSVVASDTKATSPTIVPVQVAVGLPTLSSVTTLTGGLQDTDFPISFDTLLAASNATNPNGPVQFRIKAVSTGTLLLNGVAVTPNALFSEGDTLTWHPATGASGSALNAFTVVSTDGTTDSLTPVTVTVAVRAAPTLSTISTLPGATENTAFTISYATLLAASNLADTNAGATLSFLIEAVSSGTLTLNGSAVVPGTTLLSSGASLVWTPANGASGTLQAFTVVGNDGTLSSAPPVAVNVAVAANLAIAPLPSAFPTVVPTGKTMFIPVAGTSADGSAVTYTVTTNDPNLHATVLAGSTFVTMTVSYTPNGGSLTTGTMVFELFNNLTPTTAARIATLVNSGFYNGLIFHRVVSGFVIQGGDPTGTGNGGSGHSFDDEFNANAIFSGSGQLAMANSGPDTNDSQFFVTAGTERFLDFNHTIFGQLISGFDVRDAILSVPVDSTTDKPTNSVTMTSVSMFTDTHDAVIMLKDVGGVAAASVHVTINATNANHDTAQQVINVSIPASDSTNDPPFLGALPNKALVVNTSLQITIPYTDLESSAVQFAMGSLTNATGSITNGVLTITPTPGFTGTITVFVGVAQTSDLTTVTSNVTLADGKSYPVHSRGSRSSTYPTNAPPENQTPLYDTQFFTVTVVAAPVVSNVEAVTNASIQGWAFSASAGATSISVQASIDGAFLPAVVANITRNDLTASLGSPNHGFTIPLGSALTFGTHTIVVYAIDNVTGALTRIYQTVYTRGNPPYGNIESATASSVSGWAFDPNGGATSLNMQVFVDGVLKASGIANITRSDLTHAVGSPNHGFSFTWTGVGNGAHTISVFAFDATYGNSVLLGTRVVTNHSPIGSVDLANTTRVAGWTLDPDSPTTSINVRVDIDGVVGTPFAASGARSDIAAIYGSANHGFSFTYPSLPLAPGFHRIDVWAIDANTGALSLLGSKTVNANSSPIGRVESITATGVIGWAFDADAGSRAINVRVLIDGVQRPDASANVFRSDMVAAVGSANHGFNLGLPQLTPGVHTVVVYAIDPQNNNLVQLGAGSVTITNSTSNPQPFGNVEVFTATRVAGWAFDTASGATPVFVRVDVDGTTVINATAANIARSDMTKAVGSPNHGYDFTLSLTPNASHVVDVYYIDPQSSTPILKASKLFGTTAPVGNVELLNATTISGWAFDADYGPNPVDIRVDVDGQPGATSTASDVRNDLTRPFGSPNHGFSIPAPKLAPGVHTIVVRAIDPYTLATVIIGSATVTYT